ncbi:MAG: radical SAM protein [Candidatus Diapherotrites archaeon]|nr:radical SAM protein [Candidatus Diapherotrites archaeon]
MVRIKFLFRREPKAYSKKKRSSKLPKIRHIYWDITYKCKLNCEYCYAKPSRPLSKELDTAEIKKVIDYLAANNILAITFTGGDPLERKDIFEILSYALQKKIHTSIISNGLFPEKIEALANAGVKRIQINLESDNMKKHDKIKGTRAFDKAIQSINLAIKLGIRTSICTTIMRKNYKEIPGIFNLAFNLGADEFRLMRLMPCGMAHEKYEEISITYFEYQKLFETLTRRYMRLKKPVLIDVEEPYYLIENLIGTKAEKYIYYRSCLQGEATCSLTADGKIIPCIIGNYSEFIAGDIRKDDLLEVLEKSPIFNCFRNVKSLSVCNSCKYGGVCKGGCRCAAFGHYGKINAPDPICPKAGEFESE